MASTVPASLRERAVAGISKLSAALEKQGIPADLWICLLGHLDSNSEEHSRFASTCGRSCGWSLGSTSLSLDLKVLHSSAVVLRHSPASDNFRSRPPALRLA